jgi:N-acylneuraminate cytidylyltransferase
LQAVSQSKGALALIPARGGSKGLPHKNILHAAGLPLIAWTIRAAKNSKVIDRLILSSEDNEIIETAEAWGCEVPFIRPHELSSDEANSIDVALHALQMVSGYEYLILLQPTSPLRLASDIDAAFSLMLKHGATSCVSVCETSQSPYLMYNLQIDNQLVGLLPPLSNVNRRQDLPPVYVLNGAIYISRIDQLLVSKSFVNKDTVAYKMPIERSIDIDTQIDFENFLHFIADHDLSNLMNKAESNHGPK